MSVPNTPRSTGAGHPRQSRPAASRSRRAPRRHTLLPFALCCVGALALGVILQVLLPCLLYTSDAADD